jgi:hypothetical protein
MTDHYGNKLRCPRGCGLHIGVAGTAGKGQGNVYYCSCGIRFTSDAEENSGVPVSEEYAAGLERDARAMIDMRPWLDFAKHRSPFIQTFEQAIRRQEAERPCPTDGRRNGRRRYGYKKFPPGDRRTK